MSDGNLLVELLGLAFVGLIVRAIARLLVPGPNPIGCLGTMAAGVAGYRPTSDRSPANRGRMGVWDSSPS